MGVANTFAYTGIFIGGIVAGYIMNHFNRETLAIFVAIISAIWFWWVRHYAKSKYERKCLSSIRYI